MLRLIVACLVALAAPAGVAAAPVRGLVYDDANGDGRPSAGEAGVAGAVVALGVRQFVVTDAQGQFTLDVPAEGGIAWVRVPDGFVPGPVWARVGGHRRGGADRAPAAKAELDVEIDVDFDAEIDLGLRRLPAPLRGPIRFVVAADTHVASHQRFSADLAQVAADATALDPPPAFFTILGDITQGNQRDQFEQVDRALAGLTVPYIPVPGNHDWYDDGRTWFAHYGPDNYSFDIATTHFVVWNMAMAEREIRDYLGAELSHVAPGMTIVALTHAPPSEPVTDTLRALGVSYVLTGHTHSSRVVDHDGVIELNAEPLLMGGLDFTPAGYRVMTIDGGGALRSYHRTVVERALLRVMSPGRGQCVAPAGGKIVIAAEYDAGDPAVTVQLDCATPIALRHAGGWDWQGELPALAPGPHTLMVTARAGRVASAVSFAVCDPGPPPAAGEDWPQLGGAADHAGARDRELAPPLAARWTTAIGGHVLQAQPVIARGKVFVPASDLGDGAGGGVVALDLLTGAIRWRTATPLPVRAGVAMAGAIVAAAQIDGTVLGLDADTGAIRWHSELGAGVPAVTAAIFAPPAADAGDIVVGNQRRLAAIGAAEGGMLWEVDPVPNGRDSQSLAAQAIGDGAVFGTFQRALGGIAAWDRTTGAERWRFDGPLTTGINASPVLAGGRLYAVNGLDQVFALDAATGALDWQVTLDASGFPWGNATVGAPAVARGVLVVPTLYRDLVALDAATGFALWRMAGTLSPVRTTHYRGAREAGFEAPPVITGDLVWTADTGGRIAALDLHTGELLWQTRLGVPVLGGLAVSGDWLIAASYDGTVHGFTAGARPPAVPAPERCDAPAGCCGAGRGASSPSALVLALGVGGALLRRRRPA